MKGTICWNFHKLRLQEMIWNINEGSTEEEKKEESEEEEEGGVKWGFVNRECETENGGDCFGWEGEEEKTCNNATADLGQPHLRSLNVRNWK